MDGAPPAPALWGRPVGGQQRGVAVNGGAAPLEAPAPQIWGFVQPSDAAGVHPAFSAPDNTVRDRVPLGTPEEEAPQTTTRGERVNSRSDVELADFDMDEEVAKASRARTERNRHRRKHHKKTNMELFVEDLGIRNFFRDAGDDHSAGEGVGGEGDEDEGDGLEWYHTTRGPKLRERAASSVVAGSDGSPVRVSRVSSASVGTEEEAHVHSTESTVRAEHTRADVGVFCSDKELEENFGEGILLYFDFIKFMATINAMLTVVALVAFLPHAINEEGGFTWEDFFLASYPQKFRTLWRATVIVSIIVWFTFGPAYGIHVRRFFQKREAEDVEEPMAGTSLDIIKENRHYSYRNRFYRRVAAYMIFAAMLSGSGGISAVLQAQLSQDNRGLVAIVVSAAVILFNKMWFYTSIYLTHFEKHETWTLFRKHNVFKFFLFRILNVMVLYLVRGLTADDDRCTLLDVGLYFATQIFLEITVQNFIEVAIPLGKMWLFKGESTKTANERSRAPFDTSEEYLELLYRQFIIDLGMLVFPMMAALGMVANSLEYFLDRYRLIKLCRKPPRSRSSERRVLTFFLFLIAISSLLSFPNGAVFVLRGAGFSQCDFFADDDTADTTPPTE